MERKRTLWSEEEESYLLENLEKSNKDIGRRLNRSPNAVSQKRIRLKVADSKNFWTKEEEQYVLNNLEKSNIELGEILNRSPMSISKKRVRLGESKGKELWTKEEETYLDTYWGGYHLKTIAKNLDRSEEAIITKARRMGLGTRYNQGGRFLTTGDLAYLFGMDPGTIRNRVLEGRIEATYFGKKKIARITPESMIKYLIKDLDEIETYEIDWEAVTLYYKDIEFENTYKTREETEYEIRKAHKKENNRTKEDKNEFKLVWK